MKKVKYLILILIGILCLAGAAACSKPEILAAPQNLRMEGNRLIWDKVECATGYIIYFSGEEHEIGETYYDFTYDESRSSFEAEVLALGNGSNYLDSDWVKTSCVLKPPIVPTESLRYKKSWDGTSYSVGQSDDYYYPKELIIPDYYNGLPVTEIEPKAFVIYVIGRGAIINNTTTSVRLPKELKIIGNEAFSYFAALKEIEIPNGVVSIGAHAFDSNVQLSRVSFSSALERICLKAFYKCEQLQNFSLPSSLKQIDNEAFFGCKSLTKISLPEGVLVVGDGVFYGCESLAEIDFPKDISTYNPFSFTETAWYKNQPNGYIVINGDTLFRYKGSVSTDDVINNLPVGIKCILTKAFPNKQFVSVRIPNGVEILGKGLFESCASLKQVVFPRGITQIPTNTFWNCSSLESVYIPDGVTKIGEGAFWDCESLTEITFPSTLEVIEGGAFDDCVKLKKIHFPDSVKVVRASSFLGVLFDEVILPVSLRTLSDNSFTDNTTIYYRGTKENWKEYWENITDGSRKRIYKGTIFYYVENEADVPSDGGKYWHFDSDGKTPVVW